MKHVIIAGGAGFIGSHLCEAFLLREFAVTVLDNLTTGRRVNLEAAAEQEHFDFIECDVSGPIDVRDMRFVAEHGIDGVLNLTNPKDGSRGAMNLIELALKSKARRYLLTSCAKANGDWASEARVVDAAQRQGLSAAIARIFDVYGPRMRANDDSLISGFCVQAVSGSPLKFWREDLRARRIDACFVSDIAEGLVRLFKSRVRSFVRFNAAKSYSAPDLARKIGRLAGCEVEIEGVESSHKKSDHADMAAAQQLLDWRAMIDLEDGLRRTLAYFDAEIMAKRRKDALPEIFPWQEAS